MESYHKTVLRTFFLSLSVLLIVSSCTPTVDAPESPPTAPPSTAPPVAERPPSSHRLEGRASWYGPGFAGRQTANGEVFDPSQLTAAHKTLPFGTRVRVANLSNGRSVVVRINDRGPFKPGRIIDLSRRAAELIDMIGSGTAPVRLELLGGAGERTLITALDRTLPTYDVASAAHPVGTLLLLTSSAVTTPLVVRVVTTRTPLGVDIAISSALQRRLGEEVMLAGP